MYICLYICLQLIALYVPSVSVQASAFVNCLNQLSSHLPVYTTFADASESSMFLCHGKIGVEMITSRFQYI